MLEKGSAGRADELMAAATSLGSRLGNEPDVLMGIDICMCEKVPSDSF